MKLMKLPMFLIFFMLSWTAMAQKSKVMVMEIKAEIDPRMTRYVELALEHATSTNADIVATNPIASFIASLLSVLK